MELAHHVLFGTCDLKWMTSLSSRYSSQPRARHARLSRGCSCPLPPRWRGKMGQKIPLQAIQTITRLSLFILQLSVNAAIKLLRNEAHQTTLSTMCTFMHCSISRCSQTSRVRYRCSIRWMMRGLDSEPLIAREA